MKKRSSFVLGLIKVSPFMLGVIPFGLICGANAVESGISRWESVCMSVVIFAGASQLAVTQLMASDASLIVILLTGIVINLRMLMYSASISGYLGKERFLEKMGVAYLLTDQAYATAFQAYDQETAGEIHKVMFYMGVGSFMWATFVLSTAVGAWLGAVLPGSWELEFSVPLTFLALLMAAARSRNMRNAALIGGITAILCQGMPYNLGMMLGALCGIAGGHFFERNTDEN